MSIKLKRLIQEILNVFLWRMSLTVFRVKFFLMTVVYQ